MGLVVKSQGLRMSHEKQETLLKLSILSLAAILSFATRLFSVLRFESVIHEFDPYFNYRTTKYLAEEGFYSFHNWFDDRAWYPLGRIIGGTIYPGLMVTSAVLYHLAQLLHITIDIRNVCVFLAPLFSSLTTIVTYLLTKELRDTSSGLVAAAMISIVPGYISRSVAGSYDNEGTMEDTVEIKEEPLFLQELSDSPSDEMLQGKDAVKIEDIKTVQPIATVLITEFKRDPEESVGNVLKDEREDEEDGPGRTPLSRDQVSPVGNAKIGKRQKQREENQSSNNDKVVVWSICHKEDFMEQMSELEAQSSDICEGGIESASAVEKNPTDEDGNAVSTVACGICNEILESVSVLHKHVKIQHDNHSASPNSNSVRTLQPIHKCGICCREFKRFGFLYQHAKVHAEDRRHLCKKCGKKFFERSPLQKHETVHDKDTRFLCSACGMTFFVMQSLKRHMITHITESHHVCNVCSKSFASYSHLRTHLLTHTAVKTLSVKGNVSNVNSETVYSCNTCGERLPY